MRRTLVITVRLHDGRYHGTGDWPPAPARLFQALVAGAARGASIAQEERETLAYLELIDTTAIAAPVMRPGQPFSSFMPNNDLDAELPGTLKAGGTLSEAVAAIRASKRIQPRLFDASVPFHYFYDLTDDAPDEAAFDALAHGLYQLGRGVDMAFARAAILTSPDADGLLASYPGVVYRPADGGGNVLPAPVKGTLKSLETRHQAFSHRLRRENGGIVFAQPPKALIGQVHFDAPAAHILLDIDGPSIAPTKTHDLTVAVRDALAERLATLDDVNAALIERLVIGRNAGQSDTAARILIQPLPSIGHKYADRDNRRVLVTLPPQSPLRRQYVRWALSGLEIKSFDLVLTPADDTGMLRHYGSEDTSRLWRSVTPLALTFREQIAKKNGTTRLTEEVQARAAVAQALRQAGIAASAQTIRVQREPFAAKGSRAENFAAPPRFPASRLWHVEIMLDRPVRGPFSLGDGRFLGLGLMAPDRDAEPGHDGVFAFRILSGRTRDADPLVIVAAMRRAVMSRVDEVLGRRRDRTLPVYFSGHEADGSKAGNGEHRHIAIAYHADRLIVVAPHVLMHRSEAGEERRHRATLARALEALSDLRAGRSGRLVLAPDNVSDDDPLVAPAGVWRSVTDYVPTRHAKRLAPTYALIADIAGELSALGLPQVDIRVLEVREGPRGGLLGRAELTFKVAVKGPILIGRTRHGGGGIFERTG